MLTLLVKLFSALNSDSSSRQISLAICLGFIVGLSPFFSLHNLLLFMIVLFLRVHLGSFILSVGFFSGLSYLFSSLIVLVGEYLLTHESLNTIFTSLYQLDIFKLAHLHHTYTLGALVIGCLLSPAVYFLSNFLIKKYRMHIKIFFDNLPIVKAMKTSKFYRLYIELTSPSIISTGVK
ncbi:MAG: TIGR03546 family protein [Colwellia sp.]|nr:TIGR03546 family protein [Colwellia sp.]